MLSTDCVDLKMLKRRAQRMRVECGGRVLEGRCVVSVVFGGGFEARRVISLSFPSCHQHFKTLGWEDQSIKSSSCCHESQSRLRCSLCPQKCCGESGAASKTRVWSSAQCIRVQAKGDPNEDTNSMLTGSSLQIPGLSSISTMPGATGALIGWPSTSSSIAISGIASA